MCFTVFVPYYHPFVKKTLFLSSRPCFLSPVAKGMRNLGICFILCCSWFCFLLSPLSLQFGFVVSPGCKGEAKNLRFVVPLSNCCFLFSPFFHLCFNLSWFFLGLQTGTVNIMFFSFVFFPVLCLPFPLS